MEIFTFKKLKNSISKISSAPVNTMSTFKFSKSLFIGLMILVWGVGSVTGAPITWDGDSGTTNWGDKKNWSGNTIPGSGDDVTIGNGYSVTVNVTAKCNSLTITGGNTTTSVSITGTNSLTVTNGISIGAGSGSGDNIFLDIAAGSLTCSSINIASTNNSNRYSGVTLSTGTINVAGNITMGDANDDFTFTGAGTLNVGGNMSGGTFTPSTGTINYNGTAQTVGAYNYNNLTFSGSGTKTLQPGTTNISGNFTLTGNGTNTTAVTALTIGKNVYIENNTFFTSGAFTHNVGGNWTNNGWNATFTPGTGTINFTGNSSIINGTNATQNFNNIIVTKTAGQTISFSGSSNTLTVGGTFTLTSGNFNAPGTMTVAGDLTLSSGTFTAGSSFTESGNWTNNGATFTAGSSTVTMNGSAKIIGGSSSNTFNNLFINNNVGGILLGKDQTVNGILTLSSGLLKLGSYNLILGASAPGVSGSGYNGNMIIADGSGQVRKLFTGNGSYTFPIGDAGPNFTPVTLNFVSGTYAAGAYAAVNVTNAKHPNNSSETNYLTRYWSVSQSGISSFSCNVTGNYIYGDDVVGLEEPQSVAEFTGALPWILYPTALSSGTLTATGVSAFGDFTGIQSSPTITTSIGSLTGFTYVHAAGPSNQQSFTISGTNLSSNITITPPVDFEISTTSGSSFQSTPIILQQWSGKVNSTTIYVRLKAGLPASNYSLENIVSTSDGATTNNVILSGTVTAPTYCSSYGNTSFFTSITLVKFNTINNISTKPTNGNAYTDYTSQSSDVIVGNTYPLSVKLNTDGPYKIYATAWIDWNNNGSFDASEVYNLGTATSTDNGTTSLSPLSIAVPEGASIGTTRMRVSCRYNAYPGSCDQSFDGEVEDYSLNIIPRSISTGLITGPFNVGDAISIPYTVTGTFNSGNSFTAQLSNASGSFATPVNIGTLTSISSGIINGTIPIGATSGTGYRIRVVSSTPAITGTNNGSDLTIIAIPLITTSTGALNGFSYTAGYGPSSQLKFFTISGVNLTTNISVLPTDSFEISLSSGTSFNPQNLITLLVNTGTVGLDTIYVRMKAGLDVGDIPVNIITCTSDNAIIKNIACSGTVTTPPVINVTPATLAGFSYMYTNGPSAQKSFNVSATNLLDNVIVTPPTNFEISTTSNGTFQSTPITISASGTLSSTPIYVRMKTGAGVGTLVENVVVSSVNTTSISISCTGIVTPSPTILNSISALSGFIYTVGSGPSGEQPVIVSGTNLTANLTVTPPANFEISNTSGSNFQATPITLTQTGGSVNSTIYVRLKADLAVGNYNLASIILSSTGATSKPILCSGSVVNSTPTILASKTTATGFGYQAATGGPSSEQLVTISGSSLTANITVAPPTSYYEISLTSGSGFQSTSITLPQSSGRVNPTIIYVRLKSGLAAGDYTGTITASAGTPTKSVSLVGKVFASLITASGGGFYCIGSTINLTSTGTDIQNRYWEGPNSFYSVLQNPPLTTNATVALSGTYTVTGNVTVGDNLVTNGDFEAGNTSFGSNYKYAIPATNALYTEGVYTVVTNPYSVHSNFTTNGDHTSGSGYQMVINGAPTAGEVVWSQSVPAIPGANYVFTYWLQSVTSSNPSQLQLYVNGVAAGPVNTANTTIPLWTQFSYNVNAGTHSIINLELINQNTEAGGNDFSLDDIVFQQILSATASTDVTVSTSVPVSVLVAASVNPVIQGVTVTYTATPTNGGATPVYAWYVNNTLVSGITGSTYSYVPSNGDKIKCVLISSISCVTNNPATSNTVTMTVNISTNYWIGTTSTNWGTASNWTAGKVPLAGDNVVYATAGNNNGSPAVRDLYVDGDRTIGSLINATNKRLVIPTAKSLTVNNTITTNGADSLIHIISNSTDANGSLIFHNPSSSPVHATVEMYSKAFYNEAGATNQKYHWQYFGIPVSSVTTSPTFDGSYVRRWEESGDSITNHWISLNNNSVLLPFYGYEITQKAATTIVFQGQLVNSDFDPGQLSVTPTALFPGQHVYANPYTAAIDIRQLNFGAQTEATVYLYNTGTFDQWTQIGGGNTPGNNAGQYTAIPKSTAGNLLIPRQIPSMQALLVKAISNSSLATFGITYNSVIMNNTDQQRVKASNELSVSDKVCTMIDVTGTHYSDRMWLFTQPSCTRNFDNGWDGAKMPGIALTPQIFAVESDGNYQVNAVDDINNTLLGFQAGEDTEYTLTFTHQNLTSKYVGVFLVDLVENKTVDITESGSTYSFIAESTPTSVKRFMIATRNIEKDASDRDTQIKVFGSGNTIFVQNLGNLNGEMNIYDITGRCIKKVNFGPYGVTAVKVGTTPGAYIANAATSNERVSKRIILGK